jgi:proline dehydrogenase
VHLDLLRNVFLHASQSASLRERATRYRFVRRSVRRFLPGEKAEDALAAARALAGQGIHSLLTHLGENVTQRVEAETVTAQYWDLLDRTHAAGLPSEVSVKLTQLGLDLAPDFCFANLSKLLTHPLHQGPNRRLLWIDMENSPYVDPTLEIYERARKAGAPVGVAVQAYLYRTQQDLERLIPLGGAIRLVKGAYREPAEISYPLKKDVDDSYLQLGQRLLAAVAERADFRAVLATHDVNLIRRLAAFGAQRGIEKQRIEFAMLYGIQRDEQLRLAREGFRSCVLVSYGDFWFPWFMRRLAERPANAFFVLRNIFSR